MIKYPHSLPQGLSFLGRDRVRKVAYASNKYAIEFIETLCHHLMRYPDPKVVPIYNFRRLEETQSGCYRYFYDMELLGMLSAEEKKAINLFNRMKDRGFLPNRTSHPEVMQACTEFPKLSRFMEQVFAENRYFDYHHGNIMIDLEENYRLIDVEGFMLHSNLNHSKNAWIHVNLT